MFLLRGLCQDAPRQGCGAQYSVYYYTTPRAPAQGFFARRAAALAEKRISAYNAYKVYGAFAQGKVRTPALRPQEKEGVRMEFHATRRGCAIAATWLALAGGAVILLLAGVRPLLFLLWLAVCYGVAAPHLSSCRVRIGGNHLTIRRGLVFFSTKRIPLRFVTGCWLLRSPLCRATNTCLMIIFSSGSVSLVPGVRIADAERLAERVSHGGKLI